MTRILNSLDELNQNGSAKQMSRQPVRGTRAVCNAQAKRATTLRAPYTRRENVHSSLPFGTSEEFLVWIGKELQ